MSPKRRRSSKNRRKQTIAINSPTKDEKIIGNSYPAGNLNQNDFQSILSDGDAVNVRPRRKVIRRTEQLQYIENQNDFQSVSSDGDAVNVRPRRKVIRRTEQLQIIENQHDFQSISSDGDAVNVRPRRKVIRKTEQLQIIENQNDFQLISSDGDAVNVRPKRKVIRRTEPQIIDANLCVVTDTTNRKTRMTTRRLNADAVLPKVEDIIEETNNKAERKISNKNRKKIPAGQQRQEPSDLLSSESGNMKYDLCETKDSILSQSSSDSQTLLTVSTPEIITDTKDESEQEKCDEEIVNSDSSDTLKKSENSYDHEITDESGNSTRNEGQINKNDNPPSASLKTPNEMPTKPSNMKIETFNEDTGVQISKQSSAQKVRGAYGKSTPKPLKNQPIEKPQTRTKMPNFALIHKKASEKMEDIQQMTQRKADRARLLLSGNKPTIGLEKYAGTEDKKSHRQLNFGSENIPCQTNLPLTNEINIKSDINKVLEPKIITKAFKVKNNTNKCKLLNSKLKNRAVIESLLTNKSVPAKPYKPRDDVMVEDIVNQDLSPALRGATNINLKTIKKVGDEEKKALANKVQVVKSGLKERRDLIKGVRSNRRFELLMKMRMKV